MHTLAFRRRLAAFLSLSLAPTAFGDQLCVSGSVPLQTTNWIANLDLPKFDVALGTLQSIEFTVSVTISGSAGAESLDFSPVTITLNYSGASTLARPDNTLIVSAQPALLFVDNLQANDGTIDFRGPSGILHQGISASAANSATSLPGSSDLMTFAGPPGNPGTVQLRISAIGTSSATGAGNLVTAFTTQAQATATICYDYAPRVTSYCSGDGSGTACPCANPGGPEEGCANLFGFGSHLGTSGAAATSADTLVLEATVPTGASTLFLQGGSQLGGGSGVVFGDGLRCVGNPVVRLGTHFAVGGMATYPQSGDAPVGTAGAVPPGATRFYQAWYRQAQPFCTSAAFNLSQGLAIDWLP